MDPRTFLKHYRYDNRLVTGKYFEHETLELAAGDKVGVVLLNLGGPEKIEDIEPFLYNLFMDPVIIDIPLRGIFRHWIASLISSKRSTVVAKDYQLIGGNSPINTLTDEQRFKLEIELNNHFGQKTGIEFKTYTAMRYWHPTTEEAAEEMKADGVTKVALLPLYPHYSKTTTGSSLIYWWMLQQRNETPNWPTTYVHEYAAHPKFIEAISARIDEGLALFPDETRNKVQLLFSAHGTPVNEMKKRRDPYCCLIHSTVEQVMAYRKNDLPFHVSFQSKVGPAEWLTPSTPDKLKELAAEGHKAVLINPVAFVTDHIETAYELDIQIREIAQEAGIEHYEVTDGLNSHPAFIAALAEATIAQLKFPQEHDASSKYAALSQYKPDQRSCRCHQCEHITEAVCWKAENNKTSGTA